MRRHEVRLAELLVIEPFYPEHGGLGSRLMLADGAKLEDGRRPRTVMRRALEGEGVDLRAYRKAHADDGHGKQYVPIVCKDVAFMTCKMIEARWPGAETYGYIRLDAIRALRVQDGIGVLELYGGQRIETAQSVKTVQRNLDRGISMLHRQMESLRRQELQRMEQWRRWHLDDIVREAQATFAEDEGSAPLRIAARPRSMVANRTQESILCDGRTYISLERVLALLQTVLSDSRR